MLSWLLGHPFWAVGGLGTAAYALLYYLNRGNNLGYGLGYVAWLPFGACMFLGKLCVSLLALIGLTLLDRQTAKSKVDDPDAIAPH